MKTQDLLLLGIGVGLGYLAFKKYQQNKPKSDTQTIVTPTNLQADCEAKWNEKAKTMRLSSDALATAKANFMLSCSPVLTATV
jgi:uncharacterized membrane protein YebE (DUF533 family)